MYSAIRPVFLFLFFFSFLVSSAQNISTIAGNGYYSYSGDGGPATNAQFYIPNGLVIDAAGNMFVADKFNNVIRKITPAGIVTTVAGNGIADYTGDNVAATATSLNTVLSVTLDAAGNMYIPDFANNRVRKVNTSGIITTVAGNGYPGYFGDNAAATDAKIYGPASIAFDAAGNMYISDLYNNVIRKVNTSGIISRFAGNATLGYSGDGGAATNATLTNPTGILVDPAGNVLFCDYSNSRVRKVSTSGIITTIAGKNSQGHAGDGGPATNAELNRPNQLFLDPSGNLYIADAGNNCVRKVNTAGVISTVAGNPALGFVFSGDGGPATAAGIIGAEAVTLDAAGNIYIGDSGSFRIRKVNTSGIISTYGGGTGDGRQATGNSMNVFHTFVDKAGNLYVSDADNNRICKIDKAGIVTTIVGNQAPGYTGDGGPASAAQVDYPVGVTMDAANNMYLIDQDNSVIRKISASGIITTIGGDGTLGYGGDNGPATIAPIHFPMSLVVDNAGNVIFADKTNNRVRKISSSGIISTIAGTGVYSHTGDGTPATGATLENPVGVALDVAGNVYVSCAGDGTIRKINLSGIITNVAGTGITGTSGDGGPATAARMNINAGIWVDSNYNIFVPDGHRLCRRINANGIIKTIAGSSLAGFSGDGGPATAAQLFTPTNVTTDPAGNVYLSDYDNYRLRMVQSTQLPAIQAPSVICTGTSTATLSDATPGGTWTSWATAVATIGSSSGIITALSPGTSTIIYDVAGETRATMITVRAIATVAAITGPANVCAGGGTITLSDATPGGTWNAGNANATVSSGGVVTGVSGGTCTISYTIADPCGAAVATKTITVNPLPAVAGITGATSVCAGSSATLSDATPGGTWSAGNTNITISGGTVTGVKAGTSVVSYSVTNSCGTTSVTTTVTVNPLPNAGVIGGPSRVCVSASVTLSDASPGGTWSTSNTNVSVSGGVVAGMAVGTSVISYTVNNVCGTATATATILVDPLPNAGAITGGVSVCAGRTITLSDAVSGGLWSSASTSVSMSGATVIGISTGTAVISYSVSNICGTAIATDTITINPQPDAGSVTGPAMVCVGATIALSDATGGGTWTASNGDATVSGGSVTGVAEGTSVISYSVTNMCGTAVASMTITINPLPDAGALAGVSNICQGAAIIITGSSPGGVWSHSGGHVSQVDSLITGLSEGSDIVSYTVTNICGTDAATKTINVHPLPAAIYGPAQVCIGLSVTLTDATPGGSWYSADTTMATVGTATGKVNGITPGAPMIIYTSVDGCIATRAISVEHLPAPITGDSRVCVNAKALLSDADAGGYWRSANNSLASIDSVTGVISGVAQGVISITYTLPSGCGINKLINVDPVSFIQPITGSARVCVDSITILSEQIGGGEWTSKNTNATVSATGAVSGVKPGADTIVYTIDYVCGAVTTSFPITVGDCGNANAPVTLKVYPSPNEGSFTIDLTSDANKAGDVYLTNMLGQKVYLRPITTNVPLQVTLTPKQQSEVYLVTVSLGDNKYEAKVVIFR